MFGDAAVARRSARQLIADPDLLDAQRRPCGCRCRHKVDVAAKDEATASEKLVEQLQAKARAAPRASTATS